MAVAFTEYALDLDLPDECWSNEVLNCLMECLMDAGAWANVSCIILEKTLFKEKMYQILTLTLIVRQLLIY
jgi:hypothetical protein